MAELCRFYAGLSPRDYWQLTGYELAALREWRRAALELERQRQIAEALGH